MLRTLYAMFIIVTLLLCAAIEYSTGHESTGLRFELPDNEKMCFYEDFEGSKRHVLEYKVISGGNKDVDVKIESPNGKQVYQAIKQQSDTVVFEISWGTYTFCFSNEFSSITHKVVYFEVRPEEHRPLAFEGGKKSPSANTQIEESMESIHLQATKVMEFQKVYRLNEARDRYEAELLNQHVQWWSLAQSLIIFLTGLGEILILKRFFTDKKESVTATVSGLLQPEVVHAAPLMRP